MSDLRTYLESTLTIVLLNYFAKFFRLSFTSCIISFAIAGNLLRSCQKKLMLTKQMLEVPVRDWLVLSLSFSTLNLTLSVRYSPSNLWFKIIEYFFAIIQKQLVQLYSFTNFKKQVRNGAENISCSDNLHGNVHSQMQFQ